MNLNSNKESINAKQKPSKLNVIIYYLVIHKTQTRLLVMSSYEQEMKLVRGDLEREKKVNEGPKFKCAKVAST
jgi:hypothetical protein